MREGLWFQHKSHRHINVARKHVLSFVCSLSSGDQGLLLTCCTHFRSVEFLAVVLQDVIVSLQCVVQRARASQLRHIVVHAAVHIPQLAVEAQHSHNGVRREHYSTLYHCCISGYRARGAIGTN